MRKTFAVIMILALTCGLLFGCAFGKSTPDLPVHLIDASQSEATPVRPVDGTAVEERAVTGTGLRDGLNSLEQIVADGCRPTFGAGVDTSVVRVYENAIAVLDRYILNGYDDYARVHAIHDYLASQIAYDSALYEKYLAGGSTSSNDPAFHLDGVFLSKSAVCDGLSKAFAFLCNLEGIRAVRIVGALDGGAHAWNKVRLGDKWYNVDVTADRATYMYEGKTVVQVHHGFFLLSDASIEKPNFGRHRIMRSAEENPENYIAREDYPYHAGTTVSIGGQEYACVLHTESELVDLFKAIDDVRRAIGKIEVRLDFEGVNTDSPSVYDDAIHAAYREVKSDFLFDASRGVVPYLRYPDGVFVFLIYK